MTQPLADGTIRLLMHATWIYTFGALLVVVSMENLCSLLHLSWQRQTSSWLSHHGKAVSSLFYMASVIVPCLLYITTLLTGSLLAFAEGWHIQDAFMFIWQDVFNMGPYVALVPDTVFGYVVNNYMSLFVFVLCQLVLGFCGGLKIVGSIQDAISKSAFGFFLVVFIYSPAALALVCSCQALILAWIESWYFGEALEFIIGNLTNVQAGLTSHTPTHVGSLFVCSLFIGVTMSASGIVIQVVGCHPLAADFVRHVNDKGLATAMFTNQLSPTLWRTDHRRQRPSEPPVEMQEVDHVEAEPEQGAADTTDPVCDTQPPHAGAKQPPHTPPAQPPEELANIAQLARDLFSQAQGLSRILNAPPEEPSVEVKRPRSSAKRLRELERLEAVVTELHGVFRSPYATPRSPRSSET